jgi:peptide/nickel transport system substrate-binding protein/oligopeptide transport system substrate-binding protein
LQFDKGVAANSMNYGQNDSLDAPQQQALQVRMENVDVLQDRTMRFKEYNAIEQQLVNDVAWIPMEQRQAFGLRKPCVRGSRHAAMGFLPPDEWALIYISNDQPCVNRTV